MEIDKSKMQDVMGRYITQSLFLEIGYNEESVYTLKENDHFHNGKNYPSLKRLYIEMADPTEYEFATTYLMGWKHWLRLCENKQLRKHIDEWREELEVKLRCRGVKDVMRSAQSGNYQAAKWLADRGWDTKGAGRPSKADVDREIKIQAGIRDEYESDVVRLRAIG